MTKTIAKFTLWISLILGLALTLVGGLVFWQPGLVINSKTLNYVQEKWLNDLINWQSIHVEFVRTSFWQREIRLEAEQLKVDGEGVLIEAPKLKAKATLDLRYGQLQLINLGPIEAKELNLELALKGDQEESSSSDSSFLTALADWNRLPVETIDIRIKKANLIQDSGNVSFSGHFKLTGLNQNSKDELQVIVKDLVQGDKNLGKVTIDASIQDYNYLLDPKANISLAAKANIEQIRGSLDINIASQSKLKQNLNGKLKVDLGQTAIDLNLKGTRNDTSFKGTWGVLAREVSGAMTHVSLEPCSVEGRWGKSLDDPYDIAVACDGRTKRPVLKQEDMIARFLPEEIHFQFNSDIRFLGQGEEVLHTETSLELQEIRSGAVKILGAAMAQGPVPLNAPENHRIDVTFDFRLIVEQFSGLVNQLNGSPWSVPAPFNGLDGPARCHIKGDYSKNFTTNEFPLVCKLDLASSTQKLHIDSDGKVQLIREGEDLRPHLDFDILIDGIELVAPTMQPGTPMPALTPDERIVMSDPKDQKQPKASPEKSPVSYNLRIKTKKADSIKIHSNLLKEPVPINVDLLLTHDSPLTGKVAVQDFPLELLRRQAQIRYLRVNFNREGDKAGLDGLIEFENNDYKIAMELFGTLDKPEYRLTSDPPMSDKDLMAILLFGKHPDVLDPDKLKSVGETRAAIADGAISLISMYYLASTPIESVGYSPHSGLLSAKVNVQEGLSLTLGTDGDEQRQVGLRKRLGAGWVVDTSFVSDGDSSLTRTIAMLKWGRRY
ncbi:translocation/assembly module TamB domain-containing protein [Pseudobacteriovorax antillogorgiicola]|uniref:Translocation and assembly module TamB C-terminal domain-containing protein n=1 Tax=Pseudobacteriovorax antillogorgiicola TaxID=1513793 RepID=A0A1Y6BEQ8_9BACT|nr:translocation/assembly module TamB domain-containing protein [Pseudobacteriovorax antillogorgiicola]TCS56423.1 uncharacterized protein DUF490 [Pseudobacteriovorax antillogorgiicola]SMF05695.1 Family of unknown function [Pseudobacteriovorax antillogorgiicola]